MKYSTERWFLYREAPFRILYGAGLGFQEPPSRSQLSAMSDRSRKRWFIWEFIDKKLAQNLATGMSRTERTLVADKADLSRYSKGVSDNPNLRKASKPKPKRNSIEALA